MIVYFLPSSVIDGYFGEADQEITSPDKATALFLNYKPNVFDPEIHKKKNYN